MEDKKLESIYQKYRHLVLKVAYEELQDYYLAQDVCQDVFIKLNPKRITAIHTEDKMKNYLGVLAYRRALDYKRYLVSRREEHMNTVHSNISVKFKVDYDMCINDLIMELFNELKKKNEDWFEIIVRLDVYDEDQELAARDMNISHGALRMKYHRAKMWINKNYRAQYEEIKWF